MQLLLQAKSKSLWVLVLTLVGLDALLLASRPALWLDIVGSGFVILTASTAVILTSGVVWQDFRTGAVQLWLLKPVSPVRFYLEGLLDAIVAGALLLVVLLLGTRIAIAAVGVDLSSDILVLLPRLLLTVLLVSAIAFGLSAWVGQGAAIGSLVLFFAGMLIERDLAVVAALGSYWTPVVRALLFPESALIAVTDVVSGKSSGAAWLPLLRVLAYAAAWILIGTAGVRRAVGRSGLARAQGS